MPPKKKGKRHPKVPASRPFSTSPTGAERKPSRGGEPPKGRALKSTPPGPKRFKNPAITTYEDTSWEYKKNKPKKRGKR